MRRSFAAVTIAGLALIAAGCSSGPQPPQPGTPAFYWAAAKSTYAAGDFLKASDNLSQLARSENEYSQRAVVGSMILSAGIAQAYTDLAENFEAGARANRANPGPFRRQATLFRGQASQAALQCTEYLHKYMGANKADPLAIDFEFPSGSANEPVQLQRVAKGMLFPEAEIESLQKSMVQRGVVLSVTRAVGAGEDVAKALEIFKKGDVKIARPAFLLVMAKNIHTQAELFSPKKLDQPQRVKLLCQEAEEALKTMPDSKEVKDLLTKIAKTKKESKIS